MSIDAESAEAEYKYQYVVHAPAEMDVATARIGEGVALHMRHDPMNYWSQAVGFTRPVTEQTLGELLDFYRARGAEKAVFHLPAGSFTGSPELTARSVLLKQGCPVEEIRTGAKTGLRVGPVGPADAREWGELVMRAFGVPDEKLSRMAANAASLKSFRPFAAWDGDVMVACGNLLVHGDVGSLNTGATLPEYRGQGAQSALIEARVLAAREIGCRWVVAETDRAAEGTVNPSTENLRRAGLRVLYERPNWLWQNRY